MRPRGPDGHRYPTYADAMAVLDPPATFENRPTYRPLDLSLIDSIGGAHLDLTAGRYFDSVSTAEALAHELAPHCPTAPPGSAWTACRRLTGARDAGRLGVWCLGMGVDPLTLVADILTVAVFDADVFDAAFSGLVAGNAEGRIITSQGEAGFPFTEQVVARFTNGTEPMQAAGAATLQLAWNHRGLLLG